jgi:hypothetical protein
MAVPDKLEAVKKVTETLSKQNPAEEMERFAPNKEHFDTLMNSTTQQVKPTSFERIDTKAFGTEEVQNVETKPVFAEENVSAQKSGTATDQEQKRRQQQQTEEVEDIAATRSKSKSSKSNSLMGEVSKLNKSVSSISNLSPENIKTQAKDVIAQIENVKTQLSQAQTEIKPSYQTLLRNRLTHIDDSLKIALNKAGVEYTPPIASPKGAGDSNPIHKFLGYLTNSQHQLENLNVAIDQFNVTGQITPANMLAIQMKMGYVQQQIELFTSLLNKALESTKTIMNVQV